MFKRIVCLIFVMLLSVITVFAEEEQAKAPEITSLAYILYNPDTDEVLEGKEMDTKMYPASLTKMLTALTVVDMCEDIESEKITVTHESIASLGGTNSSKAGIRENEIFTVEQLLYLMILPSGNDAANAMAEHFGKEDFVKRMNEIAKELGMESSNFVNPHGLHDEEHYTTARDLAVLADAYMSEPLLAEFINAVEYTVPQTNIQAERIIRTTNWMKNKSTAYYYEYATGLKTGYTDKAGRCLAASAEKDGERYICILLNTPEVWDRNGLVRTEFLEAADIFDYAFENYDLVKIASKDEKMGQYEVDRTRGETIDFVLKNDVYATLKKDSDLSKIQIDFKPEGLLEGNKVASPVKAGQAFGTAYILLDGIKYGECEVVADIDVQPNKMIVFWQAIDLYVYIVLFVIGFAVLAFILLIVRRWIVLCYRKKAKQQRLERRERMRREFEAKEPYDYFKMD